MSPMSTVPETNSLLGTPKLSNRPFLAQCMSWVMTKGERFVSRYIVKAIYCIIWKYRDIAIFRKYRDILAIFSVHDIGQFWPFMDLHWQFLLLNLVVYWHVSFNWLVSAFTFLSSCDECQPLLNYWFLSKRRAACHQDWKFDLIRRVNKKEQLWNIIIYLFVLRINAQTNSCFIEFVKSSYFYTINQPNLCLRCNSPFIILKLYLKLFALVCLEK